MEEKMSETVKKAQKDAEAILAIVSADRVDMLEALREFHWPPTILKVAVQANMETFDHVLGRVRHFTSTRNSSVKFEFDPALMLCVEKNDIVKAEKLLVTGYCNVDYNPDPDKYLYGRPIVVASYKDYSEMIQLLTKHGANPNYIDGDNQSPLVASMNDVGNTEAFDCLVNVQDIDINQKQGKGGPPICQAVSIWSMHCIEVLIGKGCKLDIPNEFDKIPVEIAVSNISKSKERIALVDYLYDATTKQGIPLSVGKLCAKVYNENHDDGCGMG